MKGINLRFSIPNSAYGIASFGLGYHFFKCLSLVEFILFGQQSSRTGDGASSKAAAFGRCLLSY